jgi:hypothetical protein
MSYHQSPRTFGITTRRECRVRNSSAGGHRGCSPIFNTSEGTFCNPERSDGSWLANREHDCSQEPIRHSLCGFVDNVDNPVDSLLNPPHNAVSFPIGAVAIQDEGTHAEAEGPTGRTDETWTPERHDPSLGELLIWRHAPHRTPQAKERTVGSALSLSQPTGHSTSTSRHHFFRARIELAR